MTKCDRIKELIDESLHSSLCQSDEKQMREHIASCAECDGYERSLRDIKEALSAPTPMPGPLFRDRLHDTLQKNLKRPFPALGRISAAVTAAALCLVCVAALRLNSYGNAYMPSNEQPMEYTAAEGDDSAEDSTEENDYRPLQIYDSQNDGDIDEYAGGILSYNANDIAGDSGNEANDELMMGGDMVGASAADYADTTENTCDTNAYDALSKGSAQSRPMWILLFASAAAAAAAGACVLVVFLRTRAPKTGTAPAKGK